MEVFYRNFCFQTTDLFKIIFIFRILSLTLFEYQELFMIGTSSWNHSFYIKLSQNRLLFNIRILKKLYHIVAFWISNTVYDFFVEVSYLEITGSIGIFYSTRNSEN